MTLTITSENRPWGKFFNYIQNKPCTVKILSVKENSILSLQSHEKRDENWVVLEGSCECLIGNEWNSAIEGDIIVIPRLIKHRIKTSNSSVKIMEISTGEFDENDIVRYEDEYGRCEK